MRARLNWFLSGAICSARKAPASVPRANLVEQRSFGPLTNRTPRQSPFEKGLSAGLKFFGSAYWVSVRRQQRIRTWCVQRPEEIGLWCLHAAQQLQSSLVSSL